MLKLPKGNLENIRLSKAARLLGMAENKFYSWARMGVIPYVITDSGRYLVNLEDCKWALYWFDYFLKHQPIGTLQAKKQTAAQLVTTLRQEVAGVGGTFFHDFQMKPPMWKILTHNFFAFLGLALLIVWLIVHSI